MDKLYVYADFNWLEKPMLVGELGYESIRGSQSYSFKYSLSILETVSKQQRSRPKKGSVSCILYGDDELSEGSDRVPLRFIHPSELRSSGSRSRGRGRPRSVRAFRQLHSGLHTKRGLPCGDPLFVTPTGFKPVTF